MSRNLCRRDCYYCNSVVDLVEEQRPITEQETGCYYDEYKDMSVANAQCSVCEAKYLAWIHYPESSGIEKEGAPFVDLSFRSTFNDEPGPEDAPTYRVNRVVTLEKESWPACETCSTPLPYDSDTYCHRCGHSGVKCNKSEREERK